MQEQTKAKIRLIIVMIVFGSVGLFVREITLQSGSIALLRAIIGSVLLVTISLCSKKKILWSAIKKNLFLLILSGSAIGLNWIFLFEAYRYTTIAKATLSYYFAPVFVILLSPIILKERITVKKIISIFLAMIGLLLIVDMKMDSLFLNSLEIQGVLYGLIAAALYAFVMIINKYMKGISGLEITITQLIMCVIVLTPYVVVNENITFASWSTRSVLALLILGILHTGFAYFMYFTVMQILPANTIAISSYIDPISAIIFSALLLGEDMTVNQIIGAVLILGSVSISHVRKQQEDRNEVIS